MGFSYIRPKRGTATQWNSANTVLKEGEIGIEVPSTGVGTGTCNVKIGDGSTPWKSLPYAYKAEASEKLFTDKKNLTVVASAWGSDSTYEYAGYAYKADIAISGVTADMIPEVMLTPANDLDMIAPFAVAGAGKVTLYATEAPSLTISIDRISLRKAVTA